MNWKHCFIAYKLTMAALIAFVGYTLCASWIDSNFTPVRPADEHCKRLLTEYGVTEFAECEAGIRRYMPGRG